MTIPLWCLLGGVVLPYIWAGVSVPFRNQQLGSLDLSQPRLQAAALTEGGAGAWGAQMNQWEAVSVFMAANLAAFMQGVDPTGSWATASIVWLVARIVHGVFYVMGNATLRIVGFVGGVAMSVWIFVMAATV
ncbi:MAG: MAPEG family protein [Pseudomonadota bacterium]